MLKNILTVLVSFLICLAVVVIFVLWTEYAYVNGIEQAMQQSCDVSAGQIN